MKSFIAALRSLVLPWGRTSGQRIVLNGETGEIEIYDEDGDLVARISPDEGGSGLAGFYTRGFQFPENIYSFLTSGQLILGPVDLVQADVHGFLQYVMTPIAVNPYAAMTLSSGLLDTALDDAARIQLISERTQRPKAWIDGGSAAMKADLEVTGKIIADNIRCDRAQTPAPGGVPGQTSVAVNFADPMDSTPRITVTPNSGSGNLNSTNIRWAVTGESASGFTINCWRDTNFATNFDWIAISE